MSITQSAAGRESDVLRRRGKKGATVVQSPQHGHRGRINPNFSNDLAYRTTDYILNQVTVFAPAGSYRSNLDYNYGFYAQDR